MAFRTPEEQAEARAVMAAKPMPPFPIPEELADNVAFPPDYAYSVPGFEDPLNALQFAAKRLGSAREAALALRDDIDRAEATLAVYRARLAEVEAREAVATAWTREMSREVAK